MKFTLPWLREHLETTVPLEALLDRLTMLGLEVEGVDHKGGDLAAFTIAQITGVRQHPNADRLNLCTVDTGAGDMEVVCGAPNVRPGLKVAFAAIGTVIPESGQVLKASKIRGIESQGMICSARELGLGQDHDGIMELADDATIGRPLTDLIGSEGPVIDVSITPNRGDCFSVLGIARELAAAEQGRLVPRETVEPMSGSATDLSIRLDFAPEDAAACPAFAGQVVRGVTNGPSPRWLQDRLGAIGLRPISALVDITNYLTFDVGRPLHVFDADKVEGPLVLRLARPGETLLALDGQTYELDPSMTVIADDTGPVSLAGVMGGETTGVSETTTSVIVETALFDPIRTAATGRKLGLESDARTRFERGVDPAMVLPGAARAAALITELCGGEAEPLVLAGSLPPPPRSIHLRPERVERLTGVRIEQEEMAGHLGRLGCHVSSSDHGLDVVPPSWRHDLTMETDLVEEVVRLHGYEGIPPCPVRRAEAVGTVVLSPEQRRRGAVRRCLAGRGLAEAVTWSFQSEALAERFGGAALRLANPISSDLVVMRPSVIGNLALAAKRNADRGSAAGGLFEIGPRFLDDTGAQSLAVGIVRFGAAVARHWLAASRPVDAFDVKADVLAALAVAGVDVEKTTVDMPAPSWFHPGRSGVVKLGPKTALASFGELHPALLAELDLSGPVVAAEIYLDDVPLPKAKARGRSGLAVSPFPAVERDFAFVVPADVVADRLIRAIKGADRHLIRAVEVFDVYQGPGIEEGTTSLALSVRLQAQDRTLTESDIEPVVQRIVTAAEKATGARLRH
ncbi:phenylalanine--tRNA ligase subunit beta [Marinivivus vitaminiproducens]|uniref:phenylalanine--tRNA ligase subunit beta n=1 Tax=Marinivivus vitaminiproducens TaxID=3035935 RepID=UPI0027A7F2A7|nr:phenylalanine--tRNA ligase subunit beta [Geminicoccaceae bacterium SCSIO 64248]